MNAHASTLLLEAEQALATIAREEAKQQAKLILCHALGCEPAQQWRHLDCALTKKQQEVFSQTLARRLHGEPLQYILGEWEFMGLPFIVRAPVLIPRQDTETLCEVALRCAKERGYKTMLDVCCGSGCIGISLAKLGGLQVTATDIVEACVSLTRENAKRNGVDIAVCAGEWFAPVCGRFDMIVSNPPYLNAADMASLQAELYYESPLALDGGQDGLDAYRAIRAGYQAHLNPGGILLLEVGAGQVEDVCRLFDWDMDVFNDVNGIPRVVCVRPNNI